MRVVVIGLGSMGKRRLRNLRALGVRNLVGVEVRPDRRAEAEAKHQIRTFPTFSDAVADGCDAAIISLPPDLHVEAAWACHAKHIPFFLEASVILDGLAELADAVDVSGIIAMPSCTMRYFPGPRSIREIALSGQIGRPLFWRYHCGQYLPDWHPWESISDYYVSRRETGGCREIVPFELTWLTHVFGDVTQVRGSRHRIGELDADIDDLYTAELTHNAGVIGQLTVDVLSRPPVRDFYLIGSEGGIRWDGTGNVLRIARGTQGWQGIEIDTGNAEPGYINPEEPYIAEMSDFLTSVRSRQAPEYSLRDDIGILKVLEAIERDSVHAVPTDVATLTME